MHVQWFWTGGLGLERRDWASSVNILVGRFSRETLPLFCQKLLETGSLYVHFWAWDFLDPAECKSKGKTWGRLIIWFFFFFVFHPELGQKEARVFAKNYFCSALQWVYSFCRGFLSLCRTKVFFFPLISPLKRCIPEHPQHLGLFPLSVHFLLHF